MVGKAVKILKRLTCLCKHIDGILGCVLYFIVIIRARIDCSHLNFRAVSKVFLPWGSFTNYVDKMR